VIPRRPTRTWTVGVVELLLLRRFRLDVDVEVARIRMAVRFPRLNGCLGDDGD
jgi:hypothetical protein